MIQYTDVEIKSNSGSNEFGKILIFFFRLEIDVENRLGTEFAAIVKPFSTRNSLLYRVEAQPIVFVL